MGGGEAKIKIEQGKQKEKKFVHQKSLKKKFVRRLFNRENYKLTGPIRGTEGGPQIWKIKKNNLERFLI